MEASCHASLYFESVSLGYVGEGHPLDNLWDRTSADLKLREDAPGYFEDVARENGGFPASAARRGQPDLAGAMRERFWRPDQVMAALSEAGLVHHSYREHPDLYWNEFPRWPHAMRERLPHSYSLRYSRPKRGMADVSD